MIRNSGLGSRRSLRSKKEEINPLDGVANLVDIMLVFSCGLMVSLVLNWNVDLSKVSDIITKEDLMQVKNLDQAIENGTLSEDYNSKGFVYEDPKTGKMYIVKK
ncbi:DUF2149 domain-containing protein [Aminipila terrae]|uniref:DUF2149 domain-containing protein n=1 Tax=Aminipila terrae TaxID=2697030 RepID=UPI001FABA03C|nr:DUF2149 domain-containing protein [Aminipila terrae]